jgi:phosphoglycolate phosphatase
VANIIFDFDGTIADSFDYSVNFIARQAGLAPLTESEKASLHGLSLFRISRRLRVPLRKLPTLLHKGRKHMAPVVHTVEPFPGMAEVIRTLHGGKHKLYIVSTNTEPNIRRFLKRHKLNSYFSEVYGAVGMFGKAPALRRMLREQHIGTKDAVYVSDEMRDVLASQSIGLANIAVTWGFAKAEDLKARQPDAVAHSPQDIIDIVAGL